MNAEFDNLISTQWRFLHEDWSIVQRSRFHRTEIKDVQDIRKVKDFVQNKLGIIPVFFFLIVIFGVRSYPGPYRNIEKGILILYMLLKGIPTGEMGAFLPKSSFHDVYKDLFTREAHALESKLNNCLANMCSSIRLRLLTARDVNPEPFKHITMHLDGHDSRVAYLNADKASMYSYKLKKSGFRTQVCCDMNSMAVFVSQPAECRDFNDGTMLSRMAIERKTHPLDCIALDGGYTQYVEGIIAGSHILKSSDFSCPIRKCKGIALTDSESRYNDMFGSFRSRIESYFGDMQNLFHKFSHTVVNRVSEKSTSSLQFKLCCLLLNIKRMVALRDITAEVHHSFWTQDNFEYPDGNDTTLVQVLAPSYKVKINHAQSIFKLQDASLNISLTSNGDDEMDTDEGTEYEVDRIMGHRGDGETLEYHVLWKGYDVSAATWEPRSSFNQTRCIDDYWNAQRTF
ncbi:hypothetical protein BGZ46_001658 [Entomortierella lignicola]|nr:hypothetical protein BGZ46_001658 [Entomortierella lignicola]